MNIHAPEDVKRSPSAGKVESSRGEVIRLLSDWSNGDEAALDQLVTIVYEELKRMAHQRLLRERVGHTMRTGTLAHEVCLRLIKAGGVKSRNREEFFGLARLLMEQILVDYARRRDAPKRGNGRVKVSIEDAAAFKFAIDPDSAAILGAKLFESARNPDLVALNKALNELARRDKELAEVVHLLYTWGFTFEETAKILGLSTDAVKRRWKKAKIYLLKILTDAEASGDGPATMEKD